MTEETQKKNTDCVYFLASPLTCKKGNDCEFRHSESARSNPRDCWYWLSGSCLNANCAFRHPPLEAIPEGELAAGGRSRVPCYYFMQGCCVKGDKCNFMHGLPTASVTEVSQKVSKPSFAKIDIRESQTSANKGNGSATSKGSFEVHEATMEVASHKGNHVVKDVDFPVTNKLPECSDSSAPARPHLPARTNLIDRSKEATATNGRLDQAYSLDEKYLHQENQAEDDQLCSFRPGNNGLPQDASGEDQVQEGTESEEMWEESSFDVLVDDGGIDQLIYADELDYLNPYDALVEQLTGGPDSFVDFDYDHVAAYGQYYDGEYEVATYDACDQQLFYEQLRSLDNEDRMQPVMIFKNRQGKDILPRSRRDKTFDGEGRPQRLNIGSNDLRNHIVKRRRAEKNQKYGDDHNRRRHQDIGSQHSRRHQDGHFKQQEGAARQLMSPRSGSRPNRQYAGQGERIVGRQFQGRFELLGGKRPFRDLASDHEEIGAELGSGKKFRGMNDTFKSSARKERGRPAVTRVDEPLDNRGHQQPRKVDSRKEDSSFTGPKSLAQIKAEKVKALQEEGLAGQPDGGSECNGNIEAVHRIPASQIKNKVSHRFYKETVSKDMVKPARLMMPLEADFEGPKPLSVILRQKSNWQRGGNIRDPDEEYMGNQDASAGAKVVPYQITSGLGEKKSQLHNSTSLVALPTNVRTQHAADTYTGRLDKEVVGPAFITEDGLDVGDNLMEDVDFEDDEDDFAQKLRVVQS